MLSKSFGYAIRGILYVAAMREENRKIQIDEISDNLQIPKHFLGKIMNKVVKSGVISSTKGPNGGFYLNENTLDTHLIKIVETIEGLDQFESCALRLRKCNYEHPCPLHNTLDKINKEIQQYFISTSVRELLLDDKKEFLRSISII